MIGQKYEPLIPTPLNKSLPTPPLSQVPSKNDIKLSRASALTYDWYKSLLYQTINDGIRQDDMIWCVNEGVTLGAMECIEIYY